jgi:branched-chain amino acid transport system substrate-binding protein
LRRSGSIATPAAAQEKLKVGILTTLSGPPAALGVQQRNGFQLALKTLGGKLGGREVELIVQTTSSSPDCAVGKAKAFVERDKVDFVVGPDLLEHSDRDDEADHRKAARS